MDRVSSNSISVVIPTQDRPELLFEAIRSVKNQTLPAKEIIIIDDASANKVDQDALRHKFGVNIKVIRNEQSRGLAWARYRGVKECTGKWVAHLDDDDLYEENFLKDAMSALKEYPVIDVLFIGVSGFGVHGQAFNNTQQTGLESFNNLSTKNNTAEELLFFSSEQLFPELLCKVPMAFQRVVTRTAVWLKISHFRKAAYARVNNLPENDDVFDYLGGPLRDSEWSIYAVATCKNTALLNRPLYLQRCDGQGYSSKVSQKEYHTSQSIIIKSTLLRASEKLKELEPWKEEIKNSAATTFFDASYFWNAIGNKKRALYMLLKAIQTKPRLLHIKFLIRIILPKALEMKIF